MFVVFLKFSADRSRAGALLDGHNDWLRRGFDQGVLMMAGSLQPNLGGALIAAGVDRAVIEAFVAEDPFVAEGVVAAEIHEIAPKRMDERLAFLAA
ncbi:YciI family protein [Rhizobium sp. TRM95796]|uniref:YciI family protein n=1 Tax=Rhizobium sp. TRM95796 TaxID=2979862 RepID=UPI0021E78BED|nr:YciI family protein [Rhizobium sp. TRM95796]MCV3764604.1 YciI family protein [Rhizobium sp. TRM95796]